MSNNPQLTHTQYILPKKLESIIYTQTKELISYTKFEEMRYLYNDIFFPPNIRHNKIFINNNYNDFL